MLKLVNINKDYYVADMTVRALKKININFRENEFVSVLGPSGCGKTTLLNLIGGLDHATGGDLLIWGRSTKHFKDRDWDVYRNHRIGFIFQSYNLIPHQSVLANVELALTIAGLDKETRIARAKEALDKVGLSDQYYKKPNQLSGGQSQRVAIARALVNNPDILLADEPTGALDTKTSTQILDLIREIAKERLVIMVTHNADLAERYSTRIIKLLDGELTDDSHPFSEETEAIATTEAVNKQKALIEAENAANNNGFVKKEKAKMSFLTAFKLSIQNIFTKKKRTTMTAIAGSIGIIGVSLVLSVSIGLQGFINDMQNDMLTGNPIEIRQRAFDVNSLTTFSRSEQKEIIAKGDYVNVDEMIAELNERLQTMDSFMVDNQITADYVNYINDMPNEFWSALVHDYGVDVSNSFYTNFKYPTQEDGRMTSITGIKKMYSSVLENIEGFEQFAPLIGTLNNPFVQAPDTRNAVTEEYVLSQYNVLYQKPGTNGIAKDANEIMIVLDKNRLMADLTLGHMGYYSQDEFINIVNKVIGEDFDTDLYDGGQIPYDNLAALTYKWFPNDTIYASSIVNANIPFTYRPYADPNWMGGLDLNVVGILEPKENLNYGMLDSGLYYTTALAEHIIKTNFNSNVAQYLRDVEKSNTFSGTAVILRKGSIIDEALPPLAFDLVQVVNGKVIDFTYEYIFDNMLVPEQAKGIIDSANVMQGLIGMFTGNTSGISVVSYDLHALGANVDALIVDDDDGNVISFDVIYDANNEPRLLPKEIQIYPPNFVQKDKVLAWLDVWNSEATITLNNGTVLTSSDRDTIVYTDLLSLIMRMISNLLTIITIALIGFTSLALIVSSVMIAIITYVSVVERIKEIGVIRSLGGRKQDVASLFIAETFIIGFIAGLIGIIVTYGLSLVINIIVTLIAEARIARFPWWVALVMLSVSIVLTLISGLVPSRSAAKKDPVVALRTE